MTISRRYLAIVTCLVFAAQATVVAAQVGNSPLPSSTDGVQPAVGNAEAGAEDAGILPASWPTIPMPTITMPKLSMPKVSWPKWPTNADGIAVSPFAPISAGASKVSAGTKKAWEGTKEIFGFGTHEEMTQPHPPTAAQQQPSFWQRLTRQEPQPTGPQTVAEWMSQPRLNP